MASRAPFLTMNRTVNPALRAVLRSPVHRLASGRFALITYTGRRSGREYTVPVLYRYTGDEVTIAVGWPDRKVWWRNLTGEGGHVRLLVRGQKLEGHAVATREGDRDALVRVQVGRRDSRNSRSEVPQGFVRSVCGRLWLRPVALGAFALLAPGARRLRRDR